MGSGLTKPEGHDQGTAEEAPDTAKTRAASGSVSIDIHAPIFELCDRLGLDPDTVAEIIFRPTEVVATIYKTRDGRKFLETKDGREAAATDTRTFDVTTYPKGVNQ